MRSEAWGCVAGLAAGVAAAATTGCCIPGWRALLVGGSSVLNAGGSPSERESELVEGSFSICTRPALYLQARPGGQAKAQSATTRRPSDVWCVPSRPRRKRRKNASSPPPTATNAQSLRSRAREVGREQIQHGRHACTPTEAGETSAPFRHNLLYPEKSVPGNACIPCPLPRSEVWCQSCPHVQPLQHSSGQVLWTPPNFPLTHVPIPNPRK